MTLCYLHNLQSLHKAQCGGDFSGKQIVLKKPARIKIIRRKQNNAYIICIITTNNASFLWHCDVEYLQMYKGHIWVEEPRGNLTGQLILSEMAA